MKILNKVACLLVAIEYETKFCSKIIFIVLLE